MKIKIMLLCTVIVWLLCMPEFSRADSFPGKIGVGLEGIGSRGMEFVDAAKTSSSYWSAVDGKELPKDEHGWPLADAQTLFFDNRATFAWAPPADDPDTYTLDMSGTYKLSFTGQADFPDPTGCSVENRKYDAKTNITTADIVVPKGNALLIVKFANTRRTPDSPINSGFSNVKLIRPGYNPNTRQIFTNSYLKAIKPFSVLRFMDFTCANNFSPHNGYYPKTIEWKDRKTPLDATQLEDIGRKGAAWEYIAELANTTGKDIWINVPAEVSDSYVKELAKLLKRTLKPDTKIYIEHSNEVWNWGFYQAVYNSMAAEDEVKKGSSNLANDGKTDTDTIRARRHARRTLEIGRIFADTFCTGSMNNRIRPVLSWWTIFPDAYDGMLSWVSKTYGAPKNYFWSIASTGYFNPEGAAPDASPQQILERMRVNADQSAKYWDRIGEIAVKYGLRHFAYEGGPDTGGGNPVNVANRIRAERSEEMAGIIRHHISDNWFGRHGDLFMYFTLSSAYSRYGCWGLIEDITKLNTPKYKTLKELSGAK
jgi:hypothetical protein